MNAGPLTGLTVVEMGGIGPGPFATMLMGDLGADVIRIDRPGVTSLFPGPPEADLLNRNKRSIALDLKRSESLDVIRSLVGRADVLVEGFRPGVAERLGFGPEVLLRENPRLVYCRITGWGQSGPLAARAGHDLDYIAITGALHAIGEAGGAPQIPINLVGDFAAGSAYMVIGALAALREVERTGTGQVVDAAIVDATAHLLTAVHAMMGVGAWIDERGVNLVDGGAPFYGVYETSDGRHVAVGAIEPQFYVELLRVLDLDLDPQAQYDKRTWSATGKRLAEAFLSRTQAEWAAVFADSDACVAPVESLRSALNHPHMAARGSLLEHDGVMQSAPAPRLSTTPGSLRLPPPRPGQHTRALLEEFDLEAARLIASGVAVQDGDIP